MEHNTRLQVSRFDIPGVITKAYQYDADGGLHYSQDLRNQKFDRAYAYDHVGRVTQALSGLEARGGQSSTGRDRPYNESFQYDPMNHLTGRTTSYWDEYHTLSDQYVNDRNTDPSWSYDADGRVVGNPETSYSYDAMGNVINFEGYGEAKTDQGFDGDGRRVRSEQWQFNEETWTWESQRLTYYVSSSVLGGAVVTELEYNGEKRRTFVHAGGSILAWQWKGTSGVSDSVNWEHRDASNVSFRATNSTGDVIGETVASREEAYPAEMDHFGVDAGTSAPLYPLPPADEGGGQYPNFGSLSEMFGGCRMDGMPISCSELSERMETGSVMAKYLIHDNNGFSVDYGRVESHGIGLFTVQYPYFKPDNEGGNPRLAWDKMIFAHGTPPKAPLVGNRLDKYLKGRQKAIDKLNNSKRCREFLQNAGIDLNAAVAALQQQHAYDGFTSSISRGSAGVIEIPTGPLSRQAQLALQFELNQTISDYFNHAPHGVTRGAVTASYPGGVLAENPTDRSDVYYGASISAAIILHEALHSSTGYGDEQLQNAFHIPISSNTNNITEALKAHGCG